MKCGRGHLWWYWSDSWTGRTLMVWIKSPVKVYEIQLGEPL